MKRNEKDWTKFCLLTHFANLHRWMAYMVMMVLSVSQLSAQDACDPEAQFTVEIDNNTIVLTASMPNPNAIYTWTWSDANGNTGTSTGLTLTLPNNFNQDNSFTIKLNVVDDYLNATCSRTIYWTESCPRVGFSYTTDVENCLVNFSPIPPYDQIFENQYWVFGDGSTSTETYPNHIYAVSGTYNVCHVAWDIIPLNGNFSINYCCQNVSVECNTGGGGGGGGLGSECCRLKHCFTHPVQDPTATYLWNFGDGKSSTEMNPCHYYDNVSTYPTNMGGTPSVIVQRCITPAGGAQSCTYISISLVSLAQPAAIYVGEPGVTTPISVVSSIDGQPLFPGFEMVGPKEVHNIGELSYVKDFTFKNHVNFCMDPCSGMVVQDHRKLTFDNNVNLDDKCCLWRSIDLEYAANFTSTNTNTISGAQYGLRTKGAMTVLRISDTYFDDNWVGIFARHPLTFATFERNTFHANAIDPHCLPFSCDQEVQSLVQIPHLQRGFAGIVGRNTTINLPAGASTAANNNMFRFMDNGIWLHNSDAEIRRCDFLSIEDEAYGQKSGNAIRFNVTEGVHSLRHWGDNTTISHSATGVRVETTSTSANTIFDSRNNNMDINKYGYRLEIGGSLAKGSTIWNNNILSSLMGIDVTMKSAEMNPSHLDIGGPNHITINSSDDSGSGILVKDGTPIGISDYNNHDINVIENFVTLNNGRSGIEVLNFHHINAGYNVLQLNDASGGSSLPYPPIGIYLSGGLKNNIYCNWVAGSTSSGPQHAMVIDASRDAIITGNTLKTTRVGIDFRGICGSLTDFAQNTLQNHDVGLRYWLGAKTGDQVNKGNRWLGTTFGVAAWHMGTTSGDLNDCRFMAAVGTSQWPPSIQAPTSFIPWFTNGNFVNITDNCNIMLTTPGTNGMDLAIATTGFNMPSNNDVYNWDARRYLYNKLVANPVLTNQAANYSSFLANQANTSVGLLQSATAQTQDLFAVPSATQQALDANSTAINATLATISGIDATMAVGGLSETQQAALLANKATATDNLAALQASATQLQAQLLASRATAANTVISFNNGITASSLHEQNEKTLLDLFLKTEAKNLPATLAQKAQVLAIAQQCPETGGFSTYWARAWYSALTGTLVVPQGCVTVSDRGNEAGKLNSEQHDGDVLFDMAPNPAQDFITVTVHQKPDWEGTSICLMDLSGRVLFSQQLENGALENKLSIQAVPDGLYLVCLKTGARMAGVQKLVILR